MKLTTWFPSHIKPVHIGVYLTKALEYRRLGFRYWDGKCWSYDWDEAQDAEDNKTWKSDLAVIQWCGLESAPKEKV